MINKVFYCIVIKEKVGFLSKMIWPCPWKTLHLARLTMWVDIGCCPVCSSHKSCFWGAAVLFCFLACQVLFSCWWRCWTGACLLLTPHGVLQMGEVWHSGPLPVHRYLQQHHRHQGTHAWCHAQVRTRPTFQILLCLLLTFLLLLLLFLSLSSQKERAL